MTQKTNFVFNGFLNLSATERMELLQEIQKFSKSGVLEQITEERRSFSYIEKAINEGRKLGPTDESACTCCGR